MTTDTTIYKQRLETELEEITKTLGEHGHQVGIGGEWSASSETMETDATDPNSVADQIEELVGNVSIVGELKGRFKAIQSALEKIEKGTYGKCEVGGEDIPADRLEANPSAATCIEHA
jgi:RNA polymerase-binding transcription factor DksA